MYQEVTKPHCSHTLELQSENLTLLAFSFFLSFNFLLLHMLHFSPRSAVNFAENWFFSYYCFYCFVIVFLRYACFHCGFHFTRCLLSLRTSSVFIWHKRAIRNPNLQLSVRIHLLKQFTDVYVDIYIYICMYLCIYLLALHDDEVATSWSVVFVAAMIVEVQSLFLRTLLTSQMSSTHVCAVCIFICIRF